MPFAYDGSLVFILNEFWESLLTSVEGTAVVCETIGEAVFSGKKTSPGRRADGVRYETVVEKRALIGDAVYIRSADKRSVVCADGLIRMVVRHDE